MKRAIERQLAETYRGRPLMIRISPRGVIDLWPKGTRQRVSGVSLRGAYERAVALDAGVAPIKARGRR